MNWDWSIVQQAAVIAVAAALGLSWIRSFRQSRRTERNEPRRIFAKVLPILKDAKASAGDAQGVYKLEGIYQDRFFQFKAIVDNMTARKLPSLWLMVTRPAPQPVTQVIDIMARANGPTSFSNFDLLPHPLPSPPGFPNDVLVRSDEAAGPAPWVSLTKLSSFFSSAMAKELLINPKGLRLVVLIAEANRARYGVFRQADFDNPVVSSIQAMELLGALIELEDDLKAESDKGRVHGRT